MSSGLRTTTFQTVRLAIHVVEAGPPDGVPAVLLHDHRRSAQALAPLLSALPAGVRGVAVDLRGHGGTEALPVQPARGLEDLAADVRAAVDHLGLGRHHLLGHGLGGGVAWKYLIRFAPDVRTAVVVDPVPLDGLPPVPPEQATLEGPEGAVLAACRAPDYDARAVLEARRRPPLLWIRGQRSEAGPAAATCAHWGGAAGAPSEAVSLDADDPISEAPEAVARLLTPLWSPGAS
jgi:pimeloyl-ACP methyl ester carboxylesterase